MSKLVPLLVATALGACGAGQYWPNQPASRSSASAMSPDLVYVAPGVQVIADYDVPIFFSDGYYWTNVNGSWYHSSSYTGGWAVSTAAPAPIRAIQGPYAYAHYRPSNYVAHNRPLPVSQITLPPNNQRAAAPVTNAPGA